MFYDIIGFARHNAQSKRLAQVKESSKKDRKSIADRFHQVKDVDDQLKTVIAETRTLTCSIQEKLSTRLKITKNTLRSICHNLHEGVIIVNYEGKILDVNTSYETNFGIKSSSLIGLDISDAIKYQNATEVDGSIFKLTRDFFKSMSKNIFNNKGCVRNCDECTNECHQTYFDGTFNPHHEAVISMKPAGKDPHMVAFSFSILDNDPDHEEEVSYILFFKNLHRAEDYTGKRVSYKV